MRAGPIRVSGLTARTELLAAAMAEPRPRTRWPRADPAAARLGRARTWPRPRCTRRRCAARPRPSSGPTRTTMFFTRAGLEQATRPAVADQHAARFVGRGRTPGGRPGLRHRLRRAGLRPRRPGGRRRRARPGHRRRGRGQPGRPGRRCSAPTRKRWPPTCCTPGVGGLLRPGPAQRRAAGCGGSRTSPRAGRWSPACSTDGVRPGSSSARRCRTTWFPADAEAEWLTDRGDTVEVGLWAGRGRRRGAGRPWSGPATTGTGWSPTRRPTRAVGPRGRRLPLRAGRRGDPVRRHRPAGPAAGGRPARPAPRLPDRRPARAHPVRHRVRGPRPAAVRRQGAAALGGRARQVGRLEIKQRGTTVDPAKLRRELRPAGPECATLIISRTPRGAVVRSPNGSTDKTVRSCWHSYRSSANVGLALSPGVCQPTRAGRPEWHRDDIPTTPDIRTSHL